MARTASNMARIEHALEALLYLLEIRGPKRHHSNELQILGVECMARLHGCLQRGLLLCVLLRVDFRLRVRFQCVEGCQVCRHCVFFGLKLRITVFDSLHCLYTHRAAPQAPSAQEARGAHAGDDRSQVGKARCDAWRVRKWQRQAHTHNAMALCAGGMPLSG